MNSADSRLVRSCFAASLLLLLTGCPPVAPPPDNGNGNDNDGAEVAEIGLRRVAEDLTSPVGLVSADDGSGRLFIVDQVGRVLILEADGNVSPEPFLDLTDEIVDLETSFDERGLLGLAFHPDFPDDDRFFVFYSVPPDPDAPDPGFEVNCRSRISEFRVSADADVADAASEQILLEIAKPQDNHNGGQIGFGPQDRFLYISVGDGGGAHDVGPGHNPEIGNSQDRSTLLGKLLRIDVDSGDPYGIPADNPFVDDPDTRDEIWAFGLRNPWRFSFDRADSTRLFIADVGQDLFEEVNLGQSGANYGWNIREGQHCFDPVSPTAPPASCPDTGAAGEPLVDPIFEYSHNNSAGEIVRISITGGFNYRGSAVPALAGQYVFGDWSKAFDEADGTLLAAEEDTGGAWTIRELRLAGDADGRINRYVLSFGQDDQGELYVLTTANTGPTGTTGEIYQIVPAP